MHMLPSVSSARVPDPRSSLCGLSGRPSSPFILGTHFPPFMSSPMYSVHICQETSLLLNKVCVFSCRAATVFFKSVSRNIVAWTAESRTEVVLEGKGKPAHWTQSD
uniref:Uncharacterized protein n=1 Tax=Sphaerodactylus townsendi TaxID=933632 RepID=A0ACB8EUT9_9SAUR